MLIPDLYRSILIESLRINLNLLQDEENGPGSSSDPERTNKIGLIQEALKALG